MDVRIEAAPMTAVAVKVMAVITAVHRFVNKALSLVGRVASSSCPSISGHSLSAVAPDHNFDRKEALAYAFA